MKLDCQIEIEKFQVDQERISTFLRTAETLQIKGLADHPLKEQCQKTSSVSHCTYLLLLNSL